MTWDYAITEDEIVIEIVEGSEVLDTIVGLPLGLEREAQMICDAHNREQRKSA